MSMIAYIDKRFSSGSLKTIETANEIIREYQAQGYTLTLRQLYYQFVSRDLIPNKQSEYKRLGSVLNDGRLAGLIDWTAMEDRTRNVRDYYFPAIQTPYQALMGAADGYSADHWDDQPNYVEVWIEKDALVGVIEGVCEEWEVPYFACRGYTSQSEQWRAGQRIARQIRNGKNAYVLHLGDHDPSGIDMTRDNEDRLKMFIAATTDAENLQINRLALNIDQVRAHKPPPNPAKDTDARFDGYIKKFGKSCWELDALKPQLISGMVESSIKELINMKQWRKSEADAEKEKQPLYDAANNLED